MALKIKIAKMRKLFFNSKALGLQKTLSLAAALLDQSFPELVEIKLESKDFKSIKNDAITNMILKDESYEPHIVEIARILLSTNDNAIDLGSNIGVNAIRFASIVPGGTVYAFEPSGVLFNLLQYNVSLNQIKNVTAYKFLVSNKESMEKIAISSFSGSNTNTGSMALTKSEFSEMVIALSLDELEFPKIRLIKMDIQGSEELALAGMKKLINRDRPIFLVEVEELHLLKQNSSSERLIQKFFDLKYSLLRIETDYPCDHIAIPNECFLKISQHIVRKKYPYKTTLLAGKRIQLFFKESKENSADRNLYTRFVVS
jgi:FkbM family methyltransferase